MEQGKFSLNNFYERRARRILPALFFVMAVCIPFAWMWLLPPDLKDFAQSLAAVSTFSSNILFWKESGYFATVAELKPLLHTWSLAVEEQYYIGFPLFLMLAWRLGKRWIITILFSVALISLGVANWGAYNAPVSTFYLIPTRGWEILLGSFVAFYFNAVKQSNNEAQSVNQILSLLGVLLILIAIFAFDKQTPFPSLYTLVPTLGTVLIILFTNENTLVYRILSKRLLVGMGLISYSAYLWHQPLFSFARHALEEQPTAYVTTSLIVLTILLAVITWKFVEMPFRKRNQISTSTLVTGSLGFVAVFILLGLYGHFTDGYERHWFDSKSSAITKTYRLMKDAKNKELEQDNGDCRFNVRNLTTELGARIKQCKDKYGAGYAILGDSHAIDLYGVFTSSAPSYPFVVGVTQGGCRPHTSASGCHYDEFLNFLESNPFIFSKIVYEQGGFYLLRTKKQDIGSRAMISKIPMNKAVEEIFINEKFIPVVKEYLERLSLYADVTWFGPRIEPHFPVNFVLKNGCNIVYKLRPGQRELFLSLDDFIKNALIDSPVRFISQNEAIGFDFAKDFMSCDTLFWSDGDHLSADGQVRFGQRFKLIEKVSD
jgi:peptidoglycan/LPS O-acetylase OafA/YrhL